MNVTMYLQMVSGLGVLLLSLSDVEHPMRTPGDFKSRIRPPYPLRVVQNTVPTKWGGVSESSHKKGGPVSV